MLGYVGRTPEWRLVDFAFVAERLGCADELRVVLDEFPPTRWRAANEALASGAYVKAADLLFEIGGLLAEADARRLAAEKLASEGRRVDAEKQLAQALAFYRSIGATRYIRECETLLADVSEISA